MKNWEKKLLSFVLTLVMTAVIIPTLFATPAYAAGHTHDSVTFSTPISTLEQLKTLYANGGSGYLTADIISSGTINVTISGKNVALCLNGHTLQEVSTAVTNKGTFSLYDCPGTGKLSSVLETWHNGASISVGDGSTFNLYSGTITGWRAVGVGSGVYVADATSSFNMYGGSIEYGRTTYKNRYGGGVYLNGGKMTMSGGTIKNNTLTSKAHGGGVYVKGGYMEWDGETVPSTAQFVMTGGEIKDNYADWSGGGIMLEAGGSFLMTGGTISGNTSGAYGKGIAIYDGDTASATRSWAYIKGGTISDNSIERSVGGRVTVESQNVTLDNAYFTGTYAYTIDYNANGGTNAPASKMGFIGFNDTPNAKYVLPSTRPTRTGYAFADWFTAASGGTKVTEESIVSNIFEKQTLYAQWTANTYTIAYNANGGEGAPEAMTAAYDAEVTLSSTVPTKTGYTFKEWNTVQGGTGTAYAAGASVKNLAASGTVTLYAQWTVNTYTVTLNNDGGSGDTSVTATYDAVLPNVTVPTWEKHVFEGYYTGENGEGDRYIGKDGKGVKAWDKTSDTTLCAFWKDSAKIESMDLLLGGDIGLRYHVAVNDPELRDSGTMTVSIGSKKPSEKTVPYSEAPKDESGAILFPFTVSSIQMAEPVKVEFKDGSGNVIAEDAKSVEDYYNLVENSSATQDQKEMVRTLVNYGYHAQQALSKTNGWSIGTDYKASKQHGSLSSTADDLKAYKPVISGSDPNVKDIQLSLLLDNKTTLCIYVQTKDGSAPAVTVDGASASPEDNGDSWWLVRITDIDALNLSTMHTVTANGYTVYLSALSYASVAGQNTIDAMRALLDYYQATLTANGKKMLTSATVEQSEYDYTGQKIEPVLTVMAGNEEVEDYHVEWNGDLINAGTYTGLVTKEGYVGGVTVKVAIKPVKVEAPIVGGITKFTYNGQKHTFLATPLKPLYTLENNSATDAGEYTAIATLMDEKNTCWTDGTTEPKTYDWWIDPMEVPVPIVKQTEFTYDGTQKTVLTVDEVNSYTVTGNTGTEAGEYTAIVTLKDKKNNCWNDEGKTTEDKTIEWSIVIVKTKVEIPAIPEATSFTYNGQAQTLEITESEYYTVTGNTATAVGSYTATVTLKDTEKYCWSDESTDPVTIPWKILKKEIAVPSYEGKNDLTYTGEVQTGVTVEENAAYTLTGNTGTNAGSYTATLALTDPTNTCWSDEGKTTDAKTIGWSIARKQITVPTAVTGLVYNGTEQTGVNGGDGYTLSGTAKATNAGSYTATATLTDTANTCWTDNSTDAKTIEWRIDKANPTVQSAVSVTYHPNGGSAEFSGSMTVEGTFSYDPASENTATFTPNDTQNYNTVTVEADVTKDPTPVSMNVSLSGKTKEETK